MTNGQVPKEFPIPQRPSGENKEHIWIHSSIPDLRDRQNPNPNRVGGRVAPPASHTTVHAGPRTAVPGSPCGSSSHSFSATVTAARKLSRSASTLRDKTPDGRVCLPSSALPEL